MATPPARSVSGFTNHEPADPLGQFGILDQFKYTVWFTDFHLSEGVTAATGTGWTVTKDGSPTVALADAAGGVMELTDGGTDTHKLWIQKIGESFLWATKKKLAILAKFKISDATQMGFVLGLQKTDTSPLDVTDGIFFIKADGSTTLQARVEKGDVGVAATVATMAANIYVEVAIVYQGKPRMVSGATNVTYYDFELYLKSSGIWRQVGTISADDVTDNAPDTEELTVSFGHVNGDGTGAKTSSYDFMMFAVER